MKIIPVSANQKEIYNRFIRQHYPPVGAFMQTWEWGAFQEALGRNIERYFLKKDSKLIAAFTLVYHGMPLDLWYAYAPRGPVISHEIAERAQDDILEHIRQWAQVKFPKLIFVRLEPPIQSLAAKTKTNRFSIPSYYIQPRFNLAVPLDMPEEKIAAGFHSSTRSNINRAEKRGVQVKILSGFKEASDQFFAMAQDTIQRNSGKNAYPDSSYFQSLFKTIPILEDRYIPHDLSIGIFCGYKDGAPAAINFVLFFGDTATYLYGASYSKYLSSKVTTYLHWSAMREAKQRGMRYYDLGGIDEIRWPTLTDFKRQFKGKEFRYMGNMDIPIRPRWYWFYNLIRRFKKD